eukprot:6178909-Pleurochrysis_carterae.AAC.1
MECLRVSLRVCVRACTHKDIFASTNDCHSRSKFCLITRSKLGQTYVVIRARRRLRGVILLSQALWRALVSSSHASQITR